MFSAHNQQNKNKKRKSHELFVAHPATLHAVERWRPDWDGGTGEWNGVKQELEWKGAACNAETGE